MVEELPTTENSDGAAEPRPKAAPVHSRFLFVDIAAARAKQLRRGALQRLADDGVEAREIPHKFERMAMKEVQRGLIDYSVPEWKGRTE